MSTRNEHLVMTPNHWLIVFYTPKCRYTRKKSINLAYLENGTYDQIVAHLERDLELSDIVGEFPIPVMTVAVPWVNDNKIDRFKTSCRYCNKLGHLIKSCSKKLRKEQKEKTRPNPKGKKIHT